MEAGIEPVSAMEALDSRGNPTIQVFVALTDRIRASASVPSGASTGENEAVELRDGAEARDGGKGVLQAVANVDEVIGPAPAASDSARCASAPSCIHFKDTFAESAIPAPRGLLLLTIDYSGHAEGDRTRPSQTVRSSKCDSRRHQPRRSRRRSWAPPQRRTLTIRAGSRRTIISK